MDQAEKQGGPCFDVVFSSEVKELVIQLFANYKKVSFKFTKKVQIKYNLKLANSSEEMN